MSDRKEEEIKIIMQRKKDGIDIPLSNNVQSRFSSTYLEYVKLIHNALPEINYQDIRSFHQFPKSQICISYNNRFNDRGDTRSFKNQFALRKDSRKIPTGHGTWKSEGRIKKRVPSGNIFYCKKKCSIGILDSKYWRSSAC